MNTLGTILIVDDAPVGRGALADLLLYQGYTLPLAGDGPQALQLAQDQNPDMILLDVMMPGMDGIELCRVIRDRQDTNQTPILILSGLAGIEDKVKGLGVGADDYMTKPFHKDELIARIHAIVRRSKGHAQSVIQTGDLVVNLDTKTVEVHGQRVHLTGKEYQMLELLSLRKGTTLTKEMFLNHL